MQRKDFEVKRVEGGYICTQYDPWKQQVFVDFNDVVDAMKKYYGGKTDKLKAAAEMFGIKKEKE